jgi:SPP1 family predicted phage head-tail adaptor
MNDTQIALIQMKTLDETDETGNPIEIEMSRRVVFAEEKSVKGIEFYQAGAIGLKPEIVFSLLKFEYLGEKNVEHEGKQYNVIRSYTVKGEKIELTCNAILGEDYAVT